MAGTIEGEVSFDDIVAESEAESSEEEGLGNGGDNEEDNGNNEGGDEHDYQFELQKPPSILEAWTALEDLQNLLKPPRQDQTGYKDLNLPTLLQERLTHMKDFLWLYTDVCSDGMTHSANLVGGQWTKAANQVAHDAGKVKGDYLSHCLCSWSKAYIKTWALPHSMPSKKFLQIADETLAAELQLHLQSIGKYIHAQDLVNYLSNTENQTRLGFKKAISLKTAQHWMGQLGYRWKKEPKGQYSDGHKHSDVVTYHQTIFIPTWCHYQPWMQVWNYKNPMIVESTLPSPSG
ncbi:hypothetical protein M404DRAFT_28385 [Pisolithus tinctorius Marx 270]|uniref:Uncharacterized protein n=1 Tax=Pisolithus tinctorius Marx 270 TaxID=870435 RepID=A0A0C3NLT5_PISTI|nr:hypothetical protein M404DRAFT_28385 [Pisolithus tinctorius Marx 270]